MKKRLACLALVLAMVFSLSVVVFADPGDGGDLPEKLSINLPCEIYCPEDCQCEDDDQDKP